VKGRCRVTCGAALLSVLACARPPVFDEAHQVAIRDSVGVFLEAFRQYAATGNWEALLGLYADGPEFRWIEDGAVAYGSVDALRQAIDAAPAGTRIVTTHDDVRITPLAPGLAWISLGFASMYLEPSGAGYGLTGASTMVVRHDSAGWRIVGGHASTRRDSSAVE
jgi:hypothetical protein